MTTYEDTLEAEIASWLIPDEHKRKEKFRRERIRHHKLIGDLLLDRLGTEEMKVLEVGGGPQPVSDLLRCAERTVIDPLSNDYARVTPCPDHVTMKAEDLTVRDCYDLVLCTNALDHVEDPDLVLHNMACALKSGGYLAVMCAENNALTNPHPAHVHNLTARRVHQLLDGDFETVHELTFERDGYRYGWVKFEGKRGQPAFALLLRRCSGYG